MAGRPLRPATDRSLGGLLPHQLANPASAAPLAQGPCGSPAFLFRAHAVLASLSTGYPPQEDTFRCITHPFAARRQGCPRAAARLACVRHAASVQSEPGSNSSIKDFDLQLLPYYWCITQSKRGLLLCEHLLDALPLAGTTLASLSLAGLFLRVAPSIQAPTLIGCEFLKNNAARRSGWLRGEDLNL